MLNPVAQKLAGRGVASPIIKIGCSFKVRTGTNPRPTPVSTITRTGSSSAARMYSPTLATAPFSCAKPNNALSFGRLNRIQQIPDSSTSYKDSRHEQVPR